MRKIATRVASLMLGLLLVLLATLIDRHLEGKMERDKKTFLTWWLLAFLAIAVAIIFGSMRAEAQDLRLLVQRNVHITSDWGMGSGVIYKKDTVITAAHLLGPNMKVDGKDATPVAIDTEHDILILYTRTVPVPDLRLNLQPTPLMVAVAVGNPMGKRNFFSIGYVGWANADIVNTSNVVMAGFSGGGVYDQNGAMLGMVVAGEGNCTFGFTIDRLVSAKRLLIFLFNRPREDVNEVLNRKTAEREASQGGDPNKCPNKSPAPARPP